MSNRYSRRWFSTFLGRIDDDVVKREVEFLARHLPTPGFTRVLDLCCGPGRHLLPLTVHGYALTGLDRDRDVLEAVQRTARTVPRAEPDLVNGDMRMLPLRSESFDAMICMWQSFGHFDADENAAVLAEMRRVVRDGGRLVLDLYHRQHCKQHLGRRGLERDGVHVVEERTMLHDRLLVRLRYDSDASTGHMDEFEWQLFDPAQLVALAETVGFAVVVVCASFDESQPATAADARMQIVLERS